ncbi:hydroxypyruvate isomerase family protein [Aestuariirhabdus litorea]|uniref:Hydroxypyruvate isomerase n=1 Tax=Aestuariirhabdus litorea TaxID=2528527 RepID=A0A3P3VRX6_9GAMM|nr:TIM barrel protein [Aestuariirhabdus litorea]RRJ83553.1 hydroxypyruvate isomerase [Aestuariirhabdus litorea]RWW96774.1 hydroxypyruvate isomerase [Endozoicomonadaceae bacterium GTF-13]
MPKFCANISLLYTEVPLEERVSRAKADGFESFEVQFPYSIEPAEWRRQMDLHGVDCVLFNVEAGDLMQGGEGLAAVPERQASFRQAVDQALVYAQWLRPAVINVLPGRCRRAQQRDLYLSTLGENLAYAAERFSALGITTCLEAINTTDMPDFLIHNSGQMAQLLEAVGRPDVKMQYDLYHMAMMQQPLTADLGHYLDRIGHIQFADAPGRGEPGSGELDLAGLFAEIDRLGYQGWVGAEYRPTRETSCTLGWRGPSQDLSLG